MAFADVSVSSASQIKSVYLQEPLSESLPVYFPSPTSQNQPTTRPLTTMDKSTQVLLFGDQTSPFVASLRRLLSIKHNALLTTFFERVFFALRAEVNRLPISFQDQFPRFTSLLDLLARTEESKTRNPALESAFHTLNQLASFVR